MLEPPFPTNEHERLMEILDYEILDTLPEISFDDLVKVASIVCKTPISLISLVDSDRQWFKARIGLEVHELPRDISFCGHTINQLDVFIVNDSDKDVRFADNPIVTGEPFVKFYAGAPLISSQGNAIGTICVIDQVPRELNQEQVTILQLLAKQVVQVMELRKQTLNRNKAIHELKEISKTLLEQKEKLVYLDKLEILSSMAAGICHEINNPLGGDRAEYRVCEKIPLEADSGVDVPR